MGTTVGVGRSFNRNPREAGEEAVLQALQQGGIGTPDFAFVFATVGYDQQKLIQAIRQATSGAPLTGCSGEGIIMQGTAVETNFGVCVMAISSDELCFANVCVPEIGADMALAGEKLAAELSPLLAADSIAAFIFVDGLVFDFDPFHQAFEKTLGHERPLPLFGGLAADNGATRQTFQYHDGQVFSRGISCVLLSGKGGVACGVNHGCVPVGSRRTITRSRGNVIYEIDGMPALDALKEYVEDGSLSQWNKVTLNLCLGFRTPEAIRPLYGDFIVRYIMDKDDREGCVTIQSDVAEGTELWILRRDKELIREGLHKISHDVSDKLGDRRAKFVLQFECMGRGKVVFREQEKIELLTSLQREIGSALPWIGFYTYGEIGPVGGYNCLHNFTAVIAVVY